jgi:DNA uptake protein ComE-like DNA-binding protein
MGVVDVNHADADALAKLPDVDPALERIVAVREEVDGFSSAEDLGIVMDLEPGVIDSLREHAVFVPR